jgi:Carboxypeptidase regulatory-like domain
MTPGFFRICLRELRGTRADATKKPRNSFVDERGAEMTPFTPLRVAAYPVRVLLILTLLVTASFVAPSTARAAGGETGNLAGTVVDSVSKAPVKNARVTAASPSGTQIAHTDGRGFFTLLGLPVDTYTLSVESPGYDSVILNGITVVGDQSLGLGTISMAKQLKTIGRVEARSKSGAFQPNQTVDSVTVSGARIVQTTGKVAATNEQNLILAVPGTSVTSAGNITIRGGLATEVGYQFDGVDYTEPFFSTNATNGRYNGLGSLQVVEGAGDATQGNVGGGVINIIPKRGTNPPFGYVDFEASGPNFGHQFSMEYGFASANGRVSDYIAYNGQRAVPFCSVGGCTGYYGSNVAQYGAFYSTGYQANDDIVNNFVYKFGHNNNQALQILYQVRDLQDFGNLGGLAHQQFYPYDPATYVPNGFAPPPSSGAVAGFPFQSAQRFSQLIGLVQGAPGKPTTPTMGELVAFNPTRFLKFEYTNSLDASTFLAVRTYNWSTLQGGSSTLEGSPDPNWAQTGGSRTGTSLEITRQLSSKNTLTFAAKYENQHPIWDGYYPYELTDLLAEIPPGFGVPSAADWAPLNSNGMCSLTNAPPGPQGCYLAKYFGHNIQRIPISGINYHESDFQVYGLALRDQWAPNSRLKFDFGIREDGANYKFGSNLPLSPDPGNPSDVDPSAISAQYLQPRVFEPRLAAAYQMGQNDSLRVGYGRSVVFLNAQTAGTPASLYNYNSYLNIPALDTTASPQCGSGTNLSRNTPGHLFKCQNYAQSLLWLYDQNFDAPDVGAAQNSDYSNYDLTYQHQFHNGWGMRLTPFYKLGTELPSFALLSQKVDPVTGQILSEVFTVNNLGINRTTGAEFGLTTPDRLVGWSGFLSMTYQNVISSTPPLIGGEDSLPINGSGSLALGDVYRAGYVTPFEARLGTSWTAKSGLRIAPILEYTRGYPYNVGTLTASGQSYGGKFYNIPQVNFGGGVTQIPGFLGVTGPGLSTNFCDPVFCGNAFHPNIAAGRGTCETPSAGGCLSHPALGADLTMEFTHNKNTVGIYMQNVFNNMYYGAIPVVNPYYQPIASGVAGVQTGKLPQANPGYSGGIFQNRGYANVPTNAYGYGPYILAPQQPFTFTVYYQREL